MIEFTFLYTWEIKIQQMMRHLRDVHSDIAQDSDVMQEAIKIAKEIESMYWEYLPNLNNPLYKMGNYLLDT